jgi:hypothetical protein
VVDGEVALVPQSRDDPRRGRQDGRAGSERRGVCLPGDEDDDERDDGRSEAADQGRYSSVKRPA